MSKVGDDDDDVDLSAVHTGSVSGLGENCYEQNSTS